MESISKANAALSQSRCLITPDSPASRLRPAFRPIQSVRQAPDRVGEGWATSITNAGAPGRSAAFALGVQFEPNAAHK
jgi:hypothetical protein